MTNDAWTLEDRIATAANEDWGLYYPGWDADEAYEAERLRDLATEE